jgi:hypothetical protein
MQDILTETLLEPINGRSLAEICVFNNSKKCLETILEHVKELSKLPKYPHKLIHLSVSKPEILNILMNYGGDGYLHSKVYGTTALHKSVKYNYIKSYKQLLYKPSLSISYPLDQIDAINKDILKIKVKPLDKNESDEYKSERRKAMTKLRYRKNKIKKIKGKIECELEPLIYSLIDSNIPIYTNDEYNIHNIVTLMKKLKIGNRAISLLQNSACRKYIKKWALYKTPIYKCMTKNRIILRIMQYFQ